MLMLQRPLIDNKDSKRRYRADVLIEEELAKIEGKMTKRSKKRVGVSGNLLMRRSSGRPIQGWWRTNKNGFPAQPLCRGAEQF